MFKIGRLLYLGDEFVGGCVKGGLTDDMQSYNDTGNDNNNGENTDGPFDQFFTGFIQIFLLREM